MVDTCDAKCLPARPDIGELRDRIAGEMSARLFDGVEVIPGSNEDVVAFLMAGVAYEMHGIVNHAFRETDPRCMCCDRLVEWAARRGITLKPARSAVGFVTLTGTPGAPIPSSPPGFALSFGGTTYRSDPLFRAQPAEIGVSGTAITRIVADAPGPDGNRNPGDVLTLSGAIPGIDADVTVTESGIVGGVADETCESLRARVIERMRRGAISANADWIMEQIKEWPGVTRVCTSPCKCCSMPSFYVFMDGTYGSIGLPPYGVPPAGLLREIEDSIFGNPQGAGLGSAPIGARGRLPCAKPDVIDVQIAGLNPSNQQVVAQVRAAIGAVFRDGICPGGSMCLRRIDEAILSVVGVKCYASVSVRADAHATVAGDYIYMDCDYFPVVGNISIL